MKTKQPDKFAKELAEYQARIEQCLQNIANKLLDDTQQKYGEHPFEVVKAYTDVLLRGGKRLRGALAICSYEMFGGSNKELIDQAAAGLEMLNAYILIADDIQDRSALRRGGPTAHTMLATYHKNHNLSGEARHFGESLAINASLFGLHESLNTFLELPVSAEDRIAALSLINQGFITTVHGQTLDIYNEYAPNVSEESAENVLIWKTAHYTFINPLQLGATLANAHKADIQVLTEFSLHAGKLFQLADDVTGIFSTQEEIGKSPLDDIKEGKRNNLILQALKLATPKDTEFLSDMLGNQKLTKQQFSKCQSIIRDSGALNNISQMAQYELTQSLENLLSDWPQKQRSFLEGLVSQIYKRLEFLANQ